MNVTCASELDVIYLTQGGRQETCLQWVFELEYTHVRDGVLLIVTLDQLRSSYVESAVAAGASAPEAATLFDAVLDGERAAACEEGAQEQRQFDASGDDGFGPWNPYARR